MFPTSSQPGSEELSAALSNLTRHTTTYGSILCGLGFSTKDNPTSYRSDYGLLPILSRSMNVDPNGAAIKTWVAQLSAHVPPGIEMTDVAHIISQFKPGPKMTKWKSSEKRRHTFEVELTEARHECTNPKCYCSTKATQAENGLMTLYLTLVVVDTGEKANGDAAPRWIVSAGEGDGTAKVSWGPSH